jgi:hypothetical protein
MFQEIKRDFAAEKERMDMEHDVKKRQMEKEKEFGTYSLFPVQCSAVQCNEVQCSGMVYLWPAYGRPMGRRIVPGCVFLMHQLTAFANNKHNFLQNMNFKLNFVKTKVLFYS